MRNFDMKQLIKYISVLLAVVVFGTVASIRIDSASQLPRPTTRVNNSKSGNGGSSVQNNNRNSTSTPARQTRGYENGHEWVDLGLPSGLKWATCNVGAGEPSDYGNYYAWGEVATKGSYTSGNSLTLGKSLNNIEGDPRYDAARANWGGAWRLPTEKECKELLEYCTLEEATVNGHKGHIVHGRNGNSIFVPRAGYCDGIAGPKSIGAGSSYWAGTAPNNQNGVYLAFGYKNTNNITRHSGRSVRPVMK